MLIAVSSFHLGDCLVTLRSYPFAPKILSLPSICVLDSSVLLSQMSQQLPAHLAVLITTYSTHRCELSKSFQFAILVFLSHVLAHEEILLACQRTSSTSFRLDLSTCRSLFRILSGLASFQRQR